MADRHELNPLQAQMVSGMLQEYSLVGVRAGWGAGKTSGIVFVCQALAEARPGVQVLLITDTGGRYDRVLHPEMSKWLGAWGWDYVSREGGRRWTHPNGAAVLVATYFRPRTRSSDANSIEGINAHVAILDECQAMPEEAAKKAIGRIRCGDPPQMLMCGLPVWGAWWIQMAETDVSGRVFLAPSSVNTQLKPQFFDLAARQLSAGEYKSKILNEPQPPEGAVFRDWNPRHWPFGNWEPQGWEYDPAMRTYLAGDWGYRHPSILLIAEDPDIIQGELVDVIVDEINPENLTVEQLAHAVRERAWPRAAMERAPGARVPIDAGSGDVAGRQKHADNAWRTTFQLLAQSPEAGGLGLSLKWTGNKQRTSLLNGIDAVRRRICDGAGRRRLLCRREVWERGLREKGVTFARAMASYVFQGSTQMPAKNGLEHPLDACRYHVINWRWTSTSAPSQAAHSAPATPMHVRDLLRQPGRWQRGQR